MSPTQLTRMEVEKLDIPLREPFAIATGTQVAALNVLVRVQLACGATGLGEAAPFPAVTGETQQAVLTALTGLRRELPGWDARAWRPLARWLQQRLPELPSARCAVETAVLDALCRSSSLPMHSFFGGASTQLETDLTIPVGDVSAASQAASRMAAAGFRTLKLKVGGRPLAEDIERIQAVAAAAPEVGLILDANAALADARAALTLLAEARRAGAQVLLLEQPLPRGDLEGHRMLCACAGVPVAADESAASVADVVQLAQQGAAQVVNIKIMKSGLIEALDMAIAARSLGLGLMIGGMVESPLALSTSACLAAGLGGFGWVDLDTHLFMDHIPLEGGFAQRAGVLDLSPIAAGHGVFCP
ncbi:MAG: dipeptide epimerase [Myxococcales bacterium]|nr:dipeptide epimerase [Myxococcota bacterium]MDW8281768.1 dipeptide epimerase [Myxococcales bacterium]